VIEAVFFSQIEFVVKSLAVDGSEEKSRRLQASGEEVGLIKGSSGGGGSGGGEYSRRNATLLALIG
jgi:hypothetical protein